MSTAIPWSAATAVAEPVKLRGHRRELRNLLLPGQGELHFKREKEPRQRELATAIARSGSSSRPHDRRMVVSSRTGRHWRKRIEPIVTAVVDLNCM